MTKNSLLLLLAALCAACSSNDSTTPEPEVGPIENTTPYHAIALSRSEANAVAFSNDLAFQVLPLATSGVDFCYSPLGIIRQLSIYANGANGATRQKFIDGLADGATSIADINLLNSRLVDELKNADSSAKLNFACSLWESPTFSFSDYFKQSLSSFNVATYECDFLTTTAIDKWVSENTNGLITQYPISQKFRPTHLILNVCNFEGIWSKVFNPKETSTQSFTLTNGSASQVKMMHAMQSGLYAEINGMKAYTLPFGNGAFRFTVLMPNDANKSMTEVASSISGDVWRTIVSQQTGMQINTSLPSFDICCSAHFEDKLENSKLAGIYQGNMDLSLMSESNVNAGLSQTTRIIIDETGAKAAAATGNDEMISPESVRLNANRPFIYIIDEKSTGTILFMGAYEGRNQ